MAVERSRVGWGFWLLWVLATTVGWFFGRFFGPFVATVVATVGGPAVMEMLPSYALLAWSGAAVGAGVGIFQWLVLRRRVSRAGWWVLASILGLAGGAVVGTTAVALAGGDPTMWAIVGGVVVGEAMGGAMAGLMQWFILRRQVSRAGWWVLASSLGWAVRGAVQFSPAGLGAQQEAMGLELLGVAGGAVGLGAVTGLALVWLLRQPLPEA